MVTASFLAAIVLFLQIGPGGPVITPPQNVTVQNNVTVQVPEPEPQATADMAAWSFQGIIINVMAPTLVSWANSLLDMPDFVRTTPEDLSFGNSAVRALAEVIRNVAYGLIALILLGWGIAKTLGQEPPYGRPLFGAALAAGNLVWWEIGIKLNNAINNTIASPDLPSIVRPHLALPALAASPSEAFAPALLVVAYAVVVLLLIAAMAFRLGWIAILIVTGSLALMCKGADQTDRFAETYIGMATGALFGQVMVVIALKLAPVLSFGGNGIAGTLLGLIVLWLAKSMPGLLSSRFAQSSGGIRPMAALMFLRRAVVRV
jgi:hypothetical protein